MHVSHGYQVCNRTEQNQRVYVPVWRCLFTSGFQLENFKETFRKIEIGKMLPKSIAQKLTTFFYILYRTITDDKIKSSRLFDIIRSCIFSKINHVNLLTLPLVICQTNYQKLSRLCTQITLKWILKICLSFWKKASMCFLDMFVFFLWTFDFENCSLSPRHIGAC